MFVKNMSYDCTKEPLEEFFPGCTEVRVPVDNDGNARGFAFVEFATSEEVKSAIDAKQGEELCGRALFLDYMGAKSQKTPGRTPGKSPGPRNAAEAGKTKVLFVKNLNY